ncbi:MAG: MBL fold metallo-hydrolase [Desulfobacterales bacterium]|nr:MBL fold metallo-hydrolase [Desulfobacterales bacterium]
MDVKQFRYAADNFSYIIYKGKRAVVIDGGAIEDILNFIDSNGLKVEFTANTHSHADHFPLNKKIVERTKAVNLDFSALIDKKSIPLEDEKILVYNSPGHTNDSVMFYTGKHLITGDTLFNGTVGNCFSGHINSFYKTIRMILSSFPLDTIIYAGHDYVKDSIAFAKKIEPNNKNIDNFLMTYDSNHVFSTLSDELQINPYLRFNEESIINVLRAKSLKTSTEQERFQSIMAIV